MIQTSKNKLKYGLNEKQPTENQINANCQIILK